jgi:hypothetical protein
VNFAPPTVSGFGGISTLHQYITPTVGIYQGAANLRANLRVKKSSVMVYGHLDLSALKSGEEAFCRISDKT